MNGPWDSLPLPGLRLEAGRIAAVNEAAEAWLGLSRRALIGQGLDAQAPRLRIAPEPWLLRRRLGEARPTLTVPRAEVAVSDRAGGWLRRRAGLHLGPDGEGLLVLLSPDAAGGRLAPSRGARDAARSAIGMAEMLAHEIKNPLAGIRGAAQLIGLDVAGQPHLADLAELIVAESRRIVALLEQVERFGDTSPPALAPTDLHGVLERARASVQLSGGAAIGTDYDPSLPPVLADADQLTRVVLNLLGNAVQATGGRGEVRLRSAYAGGPLPLLFEVIDDGPGLPEAIAEQIFEPFISGRENGTGLGLALVAKIVEEHGGEVSVESRPGRTVFRVALARA